MSSGIRERAIELLGTGLQANAVAMTLGVTDSYISQLLTEDGVTEQVQALRAQRAAQHVEVDDTIETLEKRSLDRIKQLMPMVTDMKTALRVFATLNGARKKSEVGSNNSNNMPATVVALEIPASAAVHFKMTVERQVIEVDGRSMLPMQASKVASALKDMKAQRLLESSLTASVEKLVTPSLLEQI